MSQRFEGAPAFRKRIFELESINAELLDCLQAFLDMGGHAADSPEDAITIQRSRAAIAKATGGAQ